MGGNVAHMGDERCVNIVGKPERRRPRHGCEHAIKMNLKKTVCRRGLSFIWPISPLAGRLIHLLTSGLNRMWEIVPIFHEAYRN
jgi:hypothetical protein